VIVVDTNAVVHLFLGGELTEAARGAFGKDSAWVAPILWRSEFRNVLSMLIRRGSLVLADAVAAAREAEALLAGGEFSVETQTVLELAARSGCSAYDCEFVALAIDLAVPLVTSDRQVLDSFPKHVIDMKAFGRGRS
jgi:predicted nucleic acid-binding protein